MLTAILFKSDFWKGESLLEDSASDKPDKYSCTRASRKLKTLSSSGVIFLGVKLIEDHEALLVVLIDELPNQVKNFKIMWRLNI